VQTGRQVNKPTSPARGVRRERLEDNTHIDGEVLGSAETDGLPLG